MSTRKNKPIVVYGRYLPNSMFHDGQWLVWRRYERQNQAEQAIEHFRATFGRFIEFRIGEV